jgi:hypothetical protein
MSILGEFTGHRIENEVRKGKKRAVDSFHFTVFPAYTPSHSEAAEAGIPSCKVFI